MDHSEAMRLMASEKYLLDELSPTELEEFEEHLFGCHDCATPVTPARQTPSRSRRAGARLYPQDQPQRVAMSPSPEMASSENQNIRRQTRNLPPPLEVWCLDVSPACPP